VACRGRRVGSLISRIDHNANILDACLDHLLDDDGERGFLKAIAIHERLQWQGSLIPAGGGDNCFFDVHFDDLSRSGGCQRHKSRRDRQTFWSSNR
jgi:hypothetical protein